MSTMVDLSGITREVGEARPSELELDPTFNRAVDDHWRGELAGRFEPLALGLFSIFQPNGKKIILDGQHRRLACEDVHYDEPVPIADYGQVTLEQAAELFLRINAQRNINPIDRFRKAVQASYQVESEVHALLAGRGLAIGYGSGDVGAPNAVISLYRKVGAEDTAGVIDMLRTAFADSPVREALGGDVLSAMRDLSYRYGKRDEFIDFDRLQEVLAKLTLEGLYHERDGLYKAAPQKTKRWHLAGAIIVAYNKGARQGVRLTDWGYAG